ncbi:peptidoglycan-binding protein [Methylocella tundrae]|uniref:Peptidoglycan-binding domain 1 protein n=1 Tax=Methylocella tundrae TaxID=227605 RepID=A0A4U8Z5B7_METTU|nr:peptidoglycan-binding protein [Methylocella tundrae]WPP04225.1 peptidoglycan-binding protein [Methylocella tundrae]VFU10517.1 Peptidoglycan-binding domain 1 protein [Methylocella tundrae]
MARLLTKYLANEYTELFSRLQILEDRLVDIAVIYRRITRPAVRQAYAAVEQQTNIPWFFVAILHNLECAGRFDGHLHNGDPLSARTIHTPQGRPASGDPPFTWQASAIDALSGRGLTRWSDWSVPGIAFQLESYNGWGYRNNYPFVRSPYLWSFSNMYDRGKYVADGSFVAEAVSGQCGGLTFLSYLLQQDADIRARVAFQAEEPSDRGGSQERPFPVGGECSWSPTPPIFPGVYLRAGVRRNAEVTRVQTRLAEVRCDPGVADGNFADSTRLAVMLFQARSADLSDEPLEIDGIVGPKTWGALFGPKSLAPRSSGSVSQTKAPGALGQAAVEIAAGEVGTMEDPPGSNRGMRVEEYQSSIGSFCIGQPWCMCFIYWSFKEAAKSLGADSPVPHTGSVQDAWAESSRLGSPVEVLAADAAAEDPSRVHPGMVFFIRTSDRTGHAGLVLANFNGMLETIEGNTNHGGYRDGIGVFRRHKRRLDQINLGFVSYG